jgi:type II secretory pathway predicted ATPase ExeA
MGSTVEFFSWKSNPFTFDVIPEIFVGNIHEVNQILDSINNKNKLSFIVGTTGSGKTTLLRSIETRYANDGFRHVIYISKPPKVPEDWVKVFRKIVSGRFSIFSKKDEISLYNLSDTVNRKLNGSKCLLLVDEAHEASIDSLEWLRVMSDQVGGIITVMAALPVLESKLKDNLETFLRRVSTRIELTNLSKSETRELIKRRIENVGGNDIRPFTQDAVELIYDKTGGFPREILRTCNDSVQEAFRHGISTIDADFLMENGKPAQKMPLEKVSELPEKQRILLETLSRKGELTPSELIAGMETEGYKDNDNAVRSVNNLLNRLMKEKMVERRKVGKAFKYKVSARIASLLVQA